MTYDGHGRLSIRKSPIEISPGTTYIYNTDDTIQKIWDARGARSTYTYNGRHLVRDNYLRSAGQQFAQFDRRGS